MYDEWVILTNLLGLLVGFALLSDHFEKSHVPAVVPRFLPGNWKGCFTLLVVIFVLSGLLDNIAAAAIGGTIAASVFRDKVHIGIPRGHRRSFECGRCRQRSRGHNHDHDVA